MSRVDPSKAIDASSAMAEADKLMKKTLLRWSPDYLGAEPLYKKAAQAYKQAGMAGASVDAYRKASDCAYHLKNPHMASTLLETAGKDMSLSKDVAGKTEAARLFAEAAGFLQEAGEDVRAADLKLRAAKTVEGFDKDLSARFVDECIALFDGDPEKDVYAVDPLRKSLQQHLALGKHASAMRTMDRLWKVWTRLDQKHNLYKLVLSRVVLLLAAADPVSAQGELDKYLDLPGFMDAGECAAAEELLQTYSDADADGMNKVLKKHSAFGYLEPAVTRLARGLPSVIEEGMGARVGVASSEEAASEAVSAAPVRKVDGFQFREIGGAWKEGGGGGGGEEGDEEDREAAAKAERRRGKEESEKASLFSSAPSSRGGGGGGGGGSKSTASSSSSSYRAPVAKEVGEEGEEDEDEGPIIAKAPAPKSKRGAAPAPAPAPEAEEDGFGDGGLEEAFASIGGGDVEGEGEGEVEAAVKQKQPAGKQGGAGKKSAPVPAPAPVVPDCDEADLM